MTTLQGGHTSDFTLSLFSKVPGKPEAKEAQGQPAESIPSAELQGREPVHKAEISEAELR